MVTTRFLQTTLVTIALGVLAAPALAGSLTPPAGPVAPTMKTLQQVEPRIAVGPDTTPGDANNVYIISEPGSYYLAGDLNTSSGINGILITTFGVTLDLNGFRLNGNGSGGTGIVLDSDTTTVRNGVILSWTGPGVDAQDRARNTFESLKIVNCAEAGIRTGSWATVRGCEISGVFPPAAGSTYGVLTGGLSTVADCAVSNVSGSGTGIWAGSGAYVARNSVSGTGTGIRADLDCMVENNIVRGASSTGIRANSFSTVRNNQVANGDGDGIVYGQRSMVTGNNVQKFANRGITGISASTGAMIAENTVGGCGVGIETTYFESVVVRNTAAFNTTNYILGASVPHGPIITGSGVITSDNPHANYSR